MSVLFFGVFYSKGFYIMYARKSHADNLYMHDAAAWIFFISSPMYIHMHILFTRVHSFPHISYYSIVHVL